MLMEEGKKGTSVARKEVGLTREGGRVTLIGGIG
jgi:hypothetical protein